MSTDRIIDGVTLDDDITDTEFEAADAASGEPRGEDFDLAAIEAAIQ